MVVIGTQKPRLSLKLSPSIDERAVELFYEKSVGGHEPEPDPVLVGLASAVREARSNATALVEFAGAAYADTTLTPAAAAIQIGQSATARGANVATKIDAAMAKARTTIAEIERATAAPPPPREAAAIHLEAEIRANLTRMKEKERKDAIAAAFESDNMAVVGAVLRGPTFLVGMTDATLEVIRSRYRTTKFPREMARLDRVRKAVEATMTAGNAFVRLISEAADSPFVKSASAAKQRREAIQMED